MASCANDFVLRKAVRSRMDMRDFLFAAIISNGYKTKEPYFFFKTAVVSKTYWFILLRLACRPTSLAQAATFLRTVEALAPADFILSCIFSHTRGTPMKAVGRTSFKVLTREP